MNTGDRPVIVGEVLFDRFPDGSAVLGGAPFNVAWNLHAFGRDPLLISRVGEDALGETIQATMSDWAMDTSALQWDKEHPTGAVNVTFHDGEPHYEIVPDAAYDFIESAGIPELGDISILYHGSLAARNRVTRHTLAELIRQISVPRFVDVNLRAPWWHQQDVLKLIEGAAWVKLNEVELRELEAGDPNVRATAENLRQRYGLDALIVTRGSEGAEIFTPVERISVVPELASRVVDTVGAGDAFASVILLGILQEWTLQATVERAQSFASAVVGMRGATTTDARFYARFAEAWELDR